MVIKKIKSKKYIAIIAVLATLLVVAVSAYLLLGQNKNRVETPTSGKDAADTYDKVDYSPADSEDKAYNDQIKENLGNGPSTDTPPSSSESAKVVITDANQYGQDVEVRAFISNVIQNNGTCTLSFTGPGTKVVKNVAASADASTTRCENAVIPVNTFDKKGTWQLVVSYSSANTVGQSEPKNIEIK